MLSRFCIHPNLHKFILLSIKDIETLVIFVLTPGARFELTRGFRPNSLAGCRPTARRPRHLTTIAPRTFLTILVDQRILWKNGKEKIVTKKLAPCLFYLQGSVNSLSRAMARNALFICDLSAPAWLRIKPMRNAASIASISFSGSSARCFNCPWAQSRSNKCPLSTRVLLEPISIADMLSSSGLSWIISFGSALRRW